MEWGWVVCSAGGGIVMRLSQESWKRQKQKQKPSQAEQRVRARTRARTRTEQHADQAETGHGKWLTVCPGLVRFSSVGHSRGSWEPVEVLILAAVYINVWKCKYLYLNKIEAVYPRLATNPFVAVGLHEACFALLSSFGSLQSPLV